MTHTEKLMKTILCFFLAGFVSLPLYAKEVPFSLKSINFAVQIRSLHFHPQGAELLIGGYRNSYIWDLKQRKVKYFLPAPLCQASSVEFSPQGRYVLPTSRHCQNMEKHKLFDKKDKIQLWDLSKKKQARLSFFGKHAGELKLIKIGAREDYLTSVSHDGTIKLWSLAKKKLLYSLGIPRHSQESLALLPYALSSKLNILAVHNWQDYYMLLYKLPLPPQNAQKRKKHTQALFKGPQLLHRTEYPFAKPQELFCFSSSQKFYFDGLRIRQSKDGSLGGTLQYRPQSHPPSPQKAIFNPQGSILALLTQTKKKNFRDKGEGSFQIELYKILKTKEGRRASYLSSLSLALIRVKPQSLAFHPNGRILGLADEERKLHFFSIP